MVEEVALDVMASAEEQKIPRTIHLSLVSKLQYEHREVDEAADMLSRTGSEAVPALISALTDKNDVLRGVAEVLREIGADAAMAFPH